MALFKFVRRLTHRRAASLQLSQHFSTNGNDFSIPASESGKKLEPGDNPLTNPRRGGWVSGECVDIVQPSPPIQVRLSSRRDGVQGRVYDGDYPSVTTVLDATRPKSNLFALLNWRRRQISDLGEAGYHAKVAHTKQNGTTFHEAILCHLLHGMEPKLSETNMGHWSSIAPVLSKIDKVIALESTVVHPQLMYAGTMDGLVVYDDKLCLIDWKTSTKKRRSLKECYSYPHQIVAYAGAVNHDPQYAPYQVAWGLLVLAYPDGSPADVILMSPETCQRYWDEWLVRLQLYRDLVASRIANTGGGRKLSDVASHIGGGRNVIGGNGDHSYELMTSTEDVNRRGAADIVDFYEGSIDVLDHDPSLVEFDPEHVFQEST